MLTVVGNRPQFVKAAAVSGHLRERAEEILVHTGQHYDPELSDVFFEELGPPRPDHELEVGSGSHAEQTAAILTRLEGLVGEVRPDALLVYGDTNSTLGGALVAAKAQVPLAHVEAGMRSGDRTMPEEINRLVTDSVSQLLLCPTGTAMDNLRREGLGERAVETGDVMADVALRMGPLADERSTMLDQLDLSPRGFFVATAHRAGNVDDPERRRTPRSSSPSTRARAPGWSPPGPSTRSRGAASG